MVLKVDGVCVATNKGNVLYCSSATGELDRSVFQNLSLKIATQEKESVYLRSKDDIHCVHLLRNGCIWLFATVSKSSSLSTKEQISLLQGVEFFQSAIETTLLTSNTGERRLGDSECASAITLNSITIHQIILELIPCGIVQLQPLSRILSQVNIPQKQVYIGNTKSLFGSVKLPTNLTQLDSVTKSLFNDSSSNEQKNISLDIIEKITGSGSIPYAGGVTSLVGEVRGSVLLTTPTPLLNRAVCVVFNKNIPEKPLMQGSLHMVCCGGKVSFDGKKAECSAVHQPSTNLMQYTLLPSLPYSLHLKCSALTHSNSDCELVVTLSGNLTHQFMAPFVSLNLKLPQTTSTVTSRFTGQGDQSISFNGATESDSPSLTWKVVDFPGGGEAKALVRVVGCGKEASISSGTLDFELSRWLCSQLKVERFEAMPPIPSPPWVRYLTVGEGIRLTFETQ